ncbi:hypothetical protein U1Q18_011064 [Sarracenia purpurea var. burkii]
MDSLMITTFTISVLYSAAILGPPLAHSGPLSTEFLRPNFTASNFYFIDQSGAFLASPNGTFEATISNPIPDLKYFYFSVVHADSGAVVWTANRESPISDYGKLYLTVNGLSITDDAGNPVWSTEQFSSPVGLLQLQESGNLVLLDQSNNSLWESFDHPTDTIVIGQRLPVGESLISAQSGANLSAGDYRFTVIAGDAIALWNGQIYWKLSMDTMAYKDSNLPVSYMAINGSGLYLFGANGSIIVIRAVLGASQFQIAKLESNGMFMVKSFSSSHNWVSEFTDPADNCRIPNICGKLGLCSAGQCSCLPGFYNDPGVIGDCTPADSSYSLPPACNFSTNGSDNQSNSSTSYMPLGNGLDYFSNDFTDPAIQSASLIACQDLCSRNCSCLGIFHDKSSGSCYFLENHLGSFMAGSSDRMGYIKTLLSSSAANPNGNNGRNRRFPIAALILVPSFGLFLLITLAAVGILGCRRKWRKSMNQTVKLGRRNSSSSEELDIISIPGLPVRFDFQELVSATENFSTQIGSGAFGTVYKGTLPDKTLIAVKKITSLGVQAKREFCAEIAVIGSIHHVNLVRLKGFCAQPAQRLLVFEYMNRGSLDKVLFGDGPVLEWPERFEIAVGTARGLAYLHGACDKKIIHCDVKPENILLHDNLQVKISDFGLSKLLSSGQSGLFTTMRGTRGYLAPEWLSNSAITDKSDVYSFGMVLLEIVRGRKNCSPRAQIPCAENAQSSSSPSSEPSIYFPLFALEMHEQRRYLELADPRLEGRVKSEEVEELVRVALCCVQEEPALRPSMCNVVGMLEGGLTVGMPRIASLNFLRFFGQRFTEASRIEGYNNELREFDASLLLYPHTTNAIFNSSSSGSHNSFSYTTSQQVSGPR